ncbi:MAG: multiheme c-type cytochrome [Myxococcota bacterium]
MRRSSVVLWLSIAIFAAGCGETGSPAAGQGSSAPGGSQSAQASEGPAGKSEDEHAGHRHERPLPAFDGRLLDGTPKAISDYIGKRLVLFFFNPEVEEVVPAAEAVAAISGERQRNNFEIVGVAVGADSETSRAFAERFELDFPIFDDGSARISARLGLRSRLAVIGVDDEGYLQFGMGAFPTDVPDARKIIEDQIRDSLRLPSRDAALAGALDRRPRAPDFETVRIDGKVGRLGLAEYAGKPLVLVFFLHTCPHCHHALRFFKGELAKLPEAVRPQLIGISVQDRPSAVRAMLRDEELDYFPVVTDPDSSIRTDYGVFGGVPDIMLVDANRRIAHRIKGWDEKRDPAIARMYLAKIAGQPIPMILNPKGYTGSQVCGICHDQAHATWEYTNHAGAFDTLVTHGETDDPECVSCHVVGFGQPGGYDLASAPAHLEGVGCESCHGRGGPHLSPDFVKDGDYEPICQTCHNPEHSLGFDFATFSPKISHQAIAALTPAEREAMLEGRGKPRDLLPTGSDVVGSDACRSCHEAEYATWAAHPHAHAVDSLASKGEDANAECLACHTTGFGRPGGFPSDGAAPDHPDLARVGCESCHGPGGEHVAEGSRKLGSIVSLGDKCDSCVILQICGSCHDEANDPDFRFEVEARIEAQRHGTIVPGTGRPKSDQALLHEAFDALDRRG